MIAQRFQTLPEERKEVNSPTRGKNRLMNLSPEGAGEAAGEGGREIGRQAGRQAGGWLAVRRSEGQTVGEDEALGWEPTRNKVLAAREEVLGPEDGSITPLLI